MQAKIQAVKDKVASCIALAEQKFNIKMPAVQIRFDLTGRAAGIAGRKGFAYYLRFNTQHMALGGKTWDHLLNDVVPHELAHTVCQSNPQFGRQHDAGWKRVCLALGGNGSRVYTADHAPEAIAANRPFTYTTTSGATVSVSKQIHAKIQRGVTYNARQGGKLNAQCSYSTTAPAVTQQTVQPKAAPVNNVPQQPKAPTTGGTNADKVRALIAYAKARGHSADTVIAAAVAQLGMTRALAATYTKNNWNKV